MKIGGTVLLVSAVTLLIIAGVSSAFRPTDPAGASDVYRSSLPPYNPYDSIRSNLADYLWPTSASRAVTSTFGEFRKTHFHAGIDISTHDRTGYPVFATRDGYISRISVGPDGYGKMLQIRHPDGYTSVYAHLDRYAGAVAKRVRGEQEKAERFAVEIRCTGGELPVKKGDLIAYTGQTGTGTAHLHFEIRDENSNAVNPFLCRDFTVLDSTPPTMSSLAFIPLAPNASVDGSPEPRVHRLRSAGRGAYELREKVSLTGPVGIAIAARDRSDETWFRHGVYHYRLLLDDSLLFEVKMNRVPVNEGKQIGLYYHWDLLARRKGRLEKLYVDSPNSIPFLSPNREGAGFLSGAGIAEGIHRLTILASDRHGNSSRLTAEVIINHPPAIGAAQKGDSTVVTMEEPSSVTRILASVRSSSGGPFRTRAFQRSGGFAGKRFAFLSPAAGIVKVTAENAYGSHSGPVILFPEKPTSGLGSVSLRAVCEEGYIRLTVTTTGVFTTVPRATVTGGGRAKEIALTPLDVDSYTGVYVPQDSAGGVLTFGARAEVNGLEKSARGELEVYPIVPGRAGSYSIDGGRLILEYGPTSTFKPLLVRVTRIPGESGTAYLLEPTHTILRSGIRVSLRSSSPLSGKEALYLVKSSGRTDLREQKILPDNTLAGTLERTLGQVAIMHDADPPRVSRLAIGKGRRASFAFSYDDDLSGVDYERFKTYIDGVPVIPEIDGEHHRASYKSGNQLQSGPHQLTIRLSDNQGNVASFERRFVVH